MSFIPGIKRLLRIRVTRQTVERDVNDEVGFHLAARIDELVKEGRPASEARTQALLEFGDVGDTKTRLAEIGVRRMKRGRRSEFWDMLRQDVRGGFRLLRQSPGFATVVIVTLALGIGANTAAFSLVDSLLLRPLPFDNPAGVTSVWTRYVPESGLTFNFSSLSAPEYRDYAGSTRAMHQVAAYTWIRVNLASEGGAPDWVAAIAATPELFDVLGTAPAIGRAFRTGDGVVGAPCVTVLHDGLWRERFGGDPRAIGSRIRVEGETCELIGVMPPDFFFPDRRTRLWRPLAIEAIPRLAAERESHWLAAIGRLAANTTLEQAEAELQPMMAGWRREHEHNKGHFVVLRPFRDDVVGNQRSVLLLLSGAVGLVLLIICANLANLLLTRAESRRREMAVRLALGAERGRLARQLITESMILTILGGGLALVVAVWLVRLLGATAPGVLTATGGVALDGPVLAFTAAVSALTGLLFGLLPAFQVPARRLQETLRVEGRAATGGARTNLVRQALVVGEIALSLAVVATAAHLVKSYDRLRRVDLGLEPANLLAIDVTLAGSDYPDLARVRQFYTDLRAQVAALPGVGSVGLTSDLPLRSGPGMDDFRIEGRPEPRPGDLRFNAAFIMASPGLFDALRIPVIAGRGIEERDSRDAPFVAVIDELAAKQYFAGHDPIGRRIRYYGADSTWLTIIGIAGSVRYQSPSDDPRPAVYVPHAQMPRPQYAGRGMTLAIRSNSPSEPLVSGVRRVVGALDPAVPVTNISSMDEVVAAATGQPRVATAIMGMFALAALLLGALGVYGILAYTVKARTREIGIRMALGADAVLIRRMVLRQGIVLAAIGVAAGGALSLGFSRLLTGILFDVETRDPAVLLIAATLLMVVSLLASYLPARRATRVDPLVALGG